ncbi:MAG TPA: hypothetical protein VMU89_13545 [Thermomicrobiaceae bacterium]|nr:hypothetical protein [Thermomicrobiaceae bacterium]
MGRLTDVPDDGMPMELEEMAAAQRRHYGTVLNSLRQTAHAPRVPLGASAMGRELGRSGKLGPRMTALLNLRVAAIVGCPL